MIKKEVVKRRRIKVAWRSSTGRIAALTLTEDFFRGFVEGGGGGVGCGHGVLSLPRLHGVVVLSVVVGIEEFLKPLDELKVVLELALHQFVYWNDLRTQTGSG